MRGNWVGAGGSVPILAVHVLKSGELVYLAREGPHTKIARGSGEVGRYYVGEVGDFRALHFAWYQTTCPGAYVYVPPPANSS
jgi:hypothetical protein